MGRVLAVAAGPSLVEAVVDAILAAKATDGGSDSGALEPVTVVCSSMVEAHGLRAMVLRRVADRGVPGLAAVAFTSVARLGRELAAPAMAGQALRPVERVELLAAVRAELSVDPGLFGSVAGHRTTHERLVALYQELTGLDAEAVAGLQAKAEGLSADALRVVLGVDSRLGAAADERRTLELALIELESGPPATGRLIVVNPDPVRSFDRRLLGAVVAHPDTTTVVAVTGHSAFDRRYRQRAASWGLEIQGGVGSVTDDEGKPLQSERPEPGRAGLVETASPDEEVRAAIRQIAAQAVVGAPLRSMALLYAVEQPYAGMIHEQLTAAGLPFHGPGHHRLGSSLAGRTLRRLLALAAHGMERGAVMNLLASAPIDVGDGREVPALLWDRLSRQAGVIDGSHWQNRLAELVHGTDMDRSSRSHFDSSGTVTVESTKALMSFAQEMQEQLRPPAEMTWASWARWASRLLDRYLLMPTDGSVPDAETSALDAVHRALQRIGTLDEFGVGPNVESFEATVESELDGVTMTGTGRGGIYVGPLSSATRLPFDHVLVVGLVEDRFPRQPREDSLLPDNLRRCRADLLPDRTVVNEIDGHGAALVASGSRRRTVFFTSRGDLRSDRSRAWPFALRGLVDSSVHVVASHHEGLARHGHPPSLDYFELRSLINHVDGGEPVSGHALADSDEVLAAGLSRHNRRLQDRLTPHTGGVGPGVVDPDGHLFSPTALETYASCPRKYMLQRILRLGEDERPERIAMITSLQRGKLIHQLLYRFVIDALTDDDVPEPDQPWSDERQAHLFDLLEEEVKLAQTQGVTGGQVQTEILRDRLRGEMADFLVRDHKIRRTYRSRPVRAEHEFGFDGSPLVLTLANGRRVPLRGAVDRVDETEDGGLLVIDYKAGSDNSYKKLDDDPLDRGRKLQLPLYARVLAEDRGLTGPKIGLYWFTSKNTVQTLSLDDELEDDMEGVVDAALDGIGHGLFPAVPGPSVSYPRVTFENCTYCDFDRVCPTDRQREWERVRHDPDVSRIMVMRRPAEVDDQPTERSRSKGEEST